MTTRYLDALVIGAGFGGIYQLKRLRELGLNAKVIDAAGDVGGTWYWNQYPGAMSDTESYLYRYSWDTTDFSAKEYYVKQPEVLAYLQDVTARFDLRKDMEFEIEMKSADWSDEESRWTIRTSRGDTIKTRYLITALGLLSKQNFPDIPGINDFQGEKYHTGRWPSNANLKDKRVGIIGNGSTGVQVITAIAKDVKQLICFQRNPQYSVPSGDGPVDPEYRKWVNSNYPEIWKEAKDDTLFAFGFKEVSRKTFDSDPEERERIYEQAWNKGGGFRFMFETFGDVTIDEAANKEASDFIKKKITQIVKDPEKARKLMPTQMYARRPLCDAGYYEQFNRESVEVISLKETPITRITAKGVEISTADNGQNTKEFPLDVLIFATGFDAVDGNYTRLMIKGRNGTSLKEHWSSIGPTTYLGVAVSSFPNLFMITGPNGPFCNIPPAIESHVDFISGAIEEAEKSSSSTETDRKSGPVIEATKAAEDEWTATCDELSSGSLFRKTDSWIFGANVPGKKHAVLFYFGGLSSFRARLRDVAGSGYKGFQIS